MADMAHIFGFDEVGDNVHAAIVDIYGDQGAVAVAAVDDEEVRRPLATRDAFPS